MRDKRKKRMISFLMLQMMIFSMFGCGNLDGNKMGTSGNFKENIVVSEWMYEPINHLYFHDDTVYFTTYAEIMDPDGGEHYCSNRLYCVNRNGDDVKEIPIDLGKEDPLTMITSIMLNDNTISIWLSTYDPDESSPVNVLIKTAYDGKEIMRTDMNALVNGENIDNVLQTAQGQIAAMARNNIYIFDESLKLMNQIAVDGYAIGMAVTKDNQLICASEDSNDKQQLHVINMEKWEIEKTISLGKQEAVNENSLFASGQYDICYRNNKGIYGYDLANKKAACLLNYDKSYLVGEDIQDAISAGMHDFLVINNPQDSMGCNIVLYSKQDENAENEKTAITFGAFQFDESMKRATLAFNKNNSRYQITLKEYFDENSGKSVADAVRELNEDIAKGTVPDILDLSLLTSQYVGKGLFEDLSVYIENDDELSEEQFVDSVFQAMKQDGKLYTVAPDFGIAALICKREYAYECNGLTMGQLIAFCEKHKDKLPFYADTKSDLLWILLEGSIGGYYDWESGTCQFDSQEFVNILTFCNQIMPEENSLGTNVTRNEMIQQGKVLFADEMDFVPQDILAYRNLLGGEISYIGYPNREGQGSYFAFDNQIGIYSGSNVKDGAWEFLRMLLSYEYQEKYADIYNEPQKIPVRKDCFDQLMANLSTLQEEAGEPEEGYEVITPEQEQAFRDIVNNTDKAVSYDIEMINIIDEEAQAYFIGEKDVYEAVRIIQKRCTTYMNESK